MPRRRASRSEPALEREVRQVERYEYLLVEYLKEISNEMTYLVLVVSSLFLFVLLDVLPLGVPPEQFNVVRLVFILFIVGGFALFGLSNITKRKIEKKFELIFG